MAEKTNVGNGSIYCRNHIIIKLLLLCAVSGRMELLPSFLRALLVCLLLQPSVSLPLSRGVVLEHSSTLCDQLQCPLRT